MTTPDALPYDGSIGNTCGPLYLNLFWREATAPMSAPPEVMARLGTAYALTQRSQLLALVTAALALSWLAVELAERCFAGRRQAEALLLR